MPISVTTGRSSANVDTAMGQVRADARHAYELRQREKESQRKAALEVMRQREAAKQKAAERQQREQQFQQQQHQNIQKMFLQNQQALNMQDAGHRNRLAEDEARNDFKWDLMDREDEREDEKTKKTKIRGSAVDALKGLNARMIEIIKGKYGPDADELIKSLAEKWNRLRLGSIERLEKDPEQFAKDIEALMAEATNGTLRAHRIADPSETTRWTEDKKFMLPGPDADDYDREQQKFHRDEQAETLRTSDSNFDKWAADFAAAKGWMLEQDPTLADAIRKAEWAISGMRSEGSADARKNRPGKYITQQANVLLGLQRQFAGRMAKYSNHMKQQGYLRPGSAQSMEDQAVKEAFGTDDPNQVAPQQRAPVGPTAGGQPQQAPAYGNIGDALSADQEFSANWKEISEMNLNEEGEGKRREIGKQLDALEKAWNGGVNGSIGYDDYIRERRTWAAEAEGIQWDNFAAPENTRQDGPMMQERGEDGVWKNIGFVADATDAEKREYTNRNSSSLLDKLGALIGWQKINQETGEIDVVEAPPDPEAEAGRQEKVQAEKAKQKIQEMQMQADLDKQAASAGAAQADKDRIADAAIAERAQDKAASEAGLKGDAEVGKSVSNVTLEELHSAKQFDESAEPVGGEVTYEINEKGEKDYWLTSEDGEWMHPIPRSHEASLKRIAEKPSGDPDSDAKIVARAKETTTPEEYAAAVPYPQQPEEGGLVSRKTANGNIKYWKRVDGRLIPLGGEITPTRIPEPKQTMRRPPMDKNVLPIGIF